jgi:hypothetical protein
MPASSDRDVPKVRVCHRLWEDDLEFIREIASSGGSGENAIIRQMVHSVVLQMKAKQREALDKIES